MPRRAFGSALAVALLAHEPAAGAEPLDARLTRIYAQVCAACHQRPETGAPLTGDPEAWRASDAAGREAMLANAVDGLRGMPPLGTCGFCTEDELRRLIDFMAPPPARTP